jgi:hypothetical protein
MSGDESILDALTTELERLENGATFKVVEFGVNEVTVWAVSRDAWGTPSTRYTLLTSESAAGPAAFYYDRLSPLLAGRLLLVTLTAGASYPHEVLRLLRNEHHVLIYECTTPVREQLRSVITISPLKTWYELVVLQLGAGGRLGLNLYPLFPPESGSGSTTDPITIRCAPTDEHGTVFAVVVRQPSANAVPTAAPRPHPIEVQSAVIDPGTYDVIARLVRPGRVEFQGLPAKLEPEKRKWQEIVRTVPPHIKGSDAAHLVCMLEVSGSTEQLEHRIERIESLITAAEGSGRPLKVSIVTYGPHAVERNVPEDPASALAWATTSTLALRTLRGVKGHRGPAREYTRAAQVECALREVTGRLSARDGNPVLVTVGARPPHPPKVDLATEIIPCGSKVSWRDELARLRTGLPELRFGALHGKGAVRDVRDVQDVWCELGRDARAEVDVVDMPAFAAQLGLRDPVQAVPFPVIGQRGA